MIAVRDGFAQEKGEEDQCQACENRVEHCDNKRKRDGVLEEDNPLINGHEKGCEAYCQPGYASVMVSNRIAERGEEKEK